MLNSLPTDSASRGDPKSELSAASGLNEACLSSQASGTVRVVQGAGLPLLPGGHEDPLKPGVLKQVLGTASDFMDGHVQMLNWATLPGNSAFRLHYHTNMQEVFVMIEGRVRVTVDGQSFELGAKDVILIPPNAKHTMKNLSATPAQYLVFGITAGPGGRTVVCED